MAKRYLFLGISMAILAAIIYISNPMKVASIIAAADLTMIAAGILVSLISLIFRVYKWQVLLKKPGLLELFPVQMLGMSISNMTPGKIAEPFKSVILKLRSGISVAGSLPTVMWERINDLIVMIFLSIIALHLLGGNLKILGYISIFIFIVIIAVILTVLYVKTLGMKVFSLTKRLPLLNKIPDSFITAFYGSNIKKTRIFVSFLLTMIPWLLEGVVFYCALMALDVHLSPLLLAGIVALSTIIGIASFLPGGIGSADAVMIILLGLAGVGGPVAVAGVLLTRFMSLWFAMFIGGLSFVYLSRKMELKNIFDIR
jgi:uncharacterized protein (TIRG00374 family)